MILHQLQAVKTGEEFYSLINQIEESFRFQRKRGYPEIECLTLVDRFGHNYGNPAPLTLYKGNLGDDVYVHYNVRDGFHTGRCQLRKITRFFKLIPRG